MNHYVFITDSVQRVGGIELYISSKKKYLASQGWRVTILSSPISFRSPVIPDLRDARRFLPLGISPFAVKPALREKCVDKAVALLQTDGSDDRIIIESHNDKAAPWGELIAARIRAKHIVVLLDEITFGKGVCYRDYQHFYGFKFDRKEWSGIRNVKLVLDGYRTVDEKDCVRFAIDENPVRDVFEKRVRDLPQADWTICYIGRTNKPYVPVVVGQVAAFADAHKDKQIQFVVVGDPRHIRTLLRQTKRAHANLHVVALGELVPLPRELFCKIDVVIAGSGSARCAAAEGVPTIAADPDTCLAIGYLGYNTQSSVWADPALEEISFGRALEEVLAQGVLRNMTFDYKVKTVAECCEQNMQMIAASAPDAAYYDFAYESGAIAVSRAATRKCFWSLRCPSLVLLYRSIKLRLKRILKHG